MRDNREHHSRQGSLQEGLYDTFLRSTNYSDPDILRIVEKDLPKKSTKQISPEVMGLLEESNGPSDTNSLSDSD